VTLPAGLLFENGAVSMSTDAVVSVYAGLGIDANGKLVTTSSNPLWNPNGTSTISTGAVSIVSYGSHTAPIQASNGLNWDALGRLITVSVGSAVAPLQASGGLTFDANGALVITGWTPLSLFAAGEQGVWYDPTDFSSMFQDSAGTTPVTAVEQPVGRILDKSGRGNHATQATSTARPTLRNRYNLLTFTEQFDNAAWEKSAGLTVSANAASAPDGTVTADKIVESNSATNHRLNQLASSVSLTSPFVAEVRLKSAGRTQAMVGLGNGRFTTAIVDLTNATAGAFSGVEAANLTISPSMLADGSVLVRISGVFSTSDQARFWVGPASGGSTFYTGNGVDGIFAWGASLVSAADASLPYQRVTTATDYNSDPSKFPLYLAFDGSDDSLATAAIDFSATDEMTVVAGVTNLSSVSAYSVVAELSANWGSNNGTFLLCAQGGSAATGYVTSRGVGSSSVEPTGYAVPGKIVSSLEADISLDSLKVRRNSVQTGSASTDQGASNYGNHPLFIGSRNNASLRLNGRLHQLIVRGKTSADIADAESFVAGKSGVTL